MLKRLFIKINGLKTCLHQFSIANASFNKANKAVSNLLFYRPISHISLHISDDYFLKVQITVPTPIFTTTSCAFCWWLKLVDFCNFFENLIKRSGKWGNLTNRHFRPSRIIFSPRHLTFCCILEYI